MFSCVFHWRGVRWAEKSWQSFTWSLYLWPTSFLKCIEQQQNMWCVYLLRGLTSLSAKVFVFILLKIWFWSWAAATETFVISCYWRQWFTWILTWGLTWMWVNPLPSLPFCSIQRKSLDLNLQPATAPSRGKTLPTPVQAEFTNSQSDSEKPCLNLVSTCIVSGRITLVHTELHPDLSSWKWFNTHYTSVCWGHPLDSSGPLSAANLMPSHSSEGEGGRDALTQGKICTIRKKHFRVSDCWRHKL